MTEAEKREFIKLIANVRPVYIETVAEELIENGYGNIKSYQDKITKCTEKVVELKKEIVELKKDREQCIKVIEDKYTYKTTQNGLCNVFEIVRREAVKEFARKFKRNMYRKMLIKLKGDTSPDLYSDDVEAIIDNLLKEYEE